MLHTSSPCRFCLIGTCPVHGEEAANRRARREQRMLRLEASILRSWAGMLERSESKPPNEARETRETVKRMILDAANMMENGAR